MTVRRKRAHSWTDVPETVGGHRVQSTRGRIRNSRRQMCWRREGVGYGAADGCGAEGEGVQMRLGDGDLTVGYLRAVRNSFRVGAVLLVVVIYHVSSWTCLQKSAMATNQGLVAPWKAHHCFELWLPTALWCMVCPCLPCLVHCPPPPRAHVKALPCWTSASSPGPGIFEAWKARSKQDMCGVEYGF